MKCHGADFLHAFSGGNELHLKHHAAFTFLNVNEPDCHGKIQAGDRKLPCDVGILINGCLYGE